MQEELFIGDVYVFMSISLMNWYKNRRREVAIYVLDLILKLFAKQCSNTFLKYKNTKCVETSFLSFQQ